MKKIVIIIAFVVLVIILAFLLYLFFFRPTAPPPIIEKPPIVETPPRLPVSREAWERMTIEEREMMGLPLFEYEEILPPVIEVPPVPTVPEISDVADGGLTWASSVSSDRTFGATLAGDGINAVFYQPEEGRFYRITPDGEKSLLSDQIFVGVQQITWAPNTEKAILEFRDGFRVVYDFRTERQVTLPFNWYDFSFSPTSNEFVFKLDSRYPENRWLSVARTDGTGARAVEHMGDNQDKVITTWSSNSQVLAFSRTGIPRGAWEQSILVIGQHGEKFPNFIVDGQGFEHTWDKLGEKIAYSVYSPETDYNPNLYIVNAAGDRAGRDKINTGLKTYSHKCTFNQSGDSLYCAVPREMPFGSGLVPELIEGIQDDFYKVDLKTGRIGFLAEPAFGFYSVDRVFLSNDESLLYFIDRDTGVLRYIKLR